jgi:hypothetical protein
MKQLKQQKQGKGAPAKERKIIFFHYIKSISCKTGAFFI